LPVWLSPTYATCKTRPLARTLPDSAGNRRQGVEVLNRLYRDAVEQSRRDIDGRYGVLSLSALPDNILMWSHYAQEHRGICIELDTERCPEAFPRLQPVAYRKASPVITQKFANFLVNLGKSAMPELETAMLHMLEKRDLSKSWADEEVRAWFLTKSTLWAYENEWRSLKRGPGKHPIPAGAISSVIVGCVDTEKTLDLIRPWVARRRRKVALYRAMKRAGAFALDIVPVEGFAKK